MPSWDARREPGYFFFFFFASSRTWNLGVGYDACMILYVHVQYKYTGTFLSLSFRFFGVFFWGVILGKEYCTYY